MSPTGHLVIERGCKVGYIGGRVGGAPKGGGGTQVPDGYPLTNRRAGRKWRTPKFRGGQLQT